MLRGTGPRPHTVRLNIQHIYSPGTISQNVNVLVFGLKPVINCYLTPVDRSQRNDATTSPAARMPLWTAEFRKAH